ncbi:Retrovirus-related Pol polyprotein from transposon TNT 1-94 [Artemisia annua]|uniref:Retrovirus-related Pol polyprotein from transposon TNT 1-94 n=1 Tax=Artemisia annua TaxID=35608 RepID=A0A2U1P6T6_ARTAN|nr:Retrovirus-related Pol polyprotein from transposon TNT 1-94 [Artemisia annua]
MVDGKVDKPSTSVDPTSPSWARPVLTNARLAVEVFDGTGHFGMWQSEVLDTLFQQGLDIAIEESKPEDVEERNWLTIDRLACGTVRSCLSREQRYAFSKETSAYKLWVALEEKFLKKNCQNKLFMKKRLFRFTYVPGTTMNDHITSFNQLVTDLMNMDEVFKDQDLALILLGSLPEEYELLETTLLNGKDDVSLSEVCAALYGKELRRKDKQISSSGDAEVLLVRDETPFTTHGIGSVRLQNEDGTIVTLKGVNAKQLYGTPKKVEFERIIVPDDRETVDDSPVVEGDYEEEELVEFNCGKVTKNEILLLKGLWIY